MFHSQSKEKTRPDDIRGQCFVIHETDDTAIDVWVAHDDHYYVNECADSLDVRALDDLNPWSGNEFRHCVQCHEEHKANLARRAQQLQRFGPLRGLELFAGLTKFLCSVTEFNVYLKVRVALELDWICLASWRLDMQLSFLQGQRGLTSQCAYHARRACVDVISGTIILM